MVMNRDEYTAKMKLELDEFNIKMEELESKSNEAKADARVKYKSELLKLRNQSDQAIAKLEQLRDAGEDSWEKLVAEADKIRHAFVHSINYFKAQF